MSILREREPPLCQEMLTDPGSRILALKNGDLEIQGDNGEAMMRILTEAGFNPVFAGG